MTFNQKMRAIITGLVFTLLMFGGVGQAAFAQAQALTSAPVASTACLQLQSNLRYGATDATTGGGVTALQNFLASQGYFNSAYIGSGRFGALTLRAVMQYQAAEGLPSTGFVGSLTRAAVQSRSCGTVVVPPSSTPVTIYSENPTSGPVGTSVSLTGFGFTSDNTLLIDGLVAARNVPITSSIAIACTTNPTCHGGINQTISFTIPSSLSLNCPTGSMCPMFMRLLTPGTYPVTVVNSNGTSNAVTLTVTGASNNQPLSITGLDAPASLALGQSGTWTVHALSSGAGTLHYSVVWGDEANTLTSSIAAPQNPSVQSSSTFTHAYSRSGTYTAVFTVSDDFGHSVTSSNTITVTPLY